MNALRENKQTNAAEKRVLILADCLQGAMNAGRFAVKHLFDNRTIIVLLHTYQRPPYMSTMLRDITPMLHKIAMEELTILKDNLLREFQIPAERIEKVVLEEDLKSVVKYQLEKFKNLSLVLATDMQKTKWEIPGRKIIRSINDSKIRPIFLISECITLIENSRIIVIGEKNKNILSQYIKELKELLGDNNLSMEIITDENQKEIPINKSTANHFSNREGNPFFIMNSTESIFYERVIRASPFRG